MNATMPKARPRGPKRRIYTAAKTMTTNTKSLAKRYGVSRAAAAIDSAAGSGSSAIVMRCCRGSGSFTDRAAIIVMRAPSSATVSG